MVAVRKLKLARMTVDEFLSWDSGDRTGRIWQLVDGEPVAMAPGSDAHASLQAEIAAVLRNHLLECGSACRVATEPGIVPHVRANMNYRVPDIGVTCSGPTRGPMMPEPVLLIELLSPSNEADSWANIWTYTSIPSVLEIVAIHTTRVEAEVLPRGADGGWPKQPELISGDDALELRCIGFAPPLAGLYRTTTLGMR